MKNYVNILGGQQFWLLLSNNLILLLFLPLQLLLGLIVAMLLYERTAGWRFFRACYYLPQVLSTFSIGYLFVVLIGFTGLFNFIFSITKGAPGYDTTTVDYMIYIRAFASGSATLLEQLILMNPWTRSEAQAKRLLKRILGMPCNAEMKAYYR